MAGCLWKLPKKNPGMPCRYTLSPRAGWLARVWATGKWPGPWPTAFQAKRAERCSCRARKVRSLPPFLAPARRTNDRGSAAGPWRRACLREAGSFRGPSRSPTSPRSASFSAAIEFSRYTKKAETRIRFTPPADVDAGYLRRAVDGVFLTRDLVNTPTNDMGPDELERAVRATGQAAQGKGDGCRG